MTVHWFFTKAAGASPIAATSAIAFSQSSTISTIGTLEASRAISIRTISDIGVSSGTAAISTKCMDFGDFILCDATIDIEIVAGRWKTSEGGTVLPNMIKGWGYLTMSPGGPAFAVDATIAGKDYLAAEAAVALSAADATLGAGEPYAAASFALTATGAILATRQGAAAVSVTFTAAQAMLAGLSTTAVAPGGKIDEAGVYVPGADHAALFFLGPDEAGVFISGADHADILG